MRKTKTTDFKFLFTVIAVLFAVSVLPACDFFGGSPTVIELPPSEMPAFNPNRRREPIREASGSTDSNESAGQGSNYPKVAFITQSIDDQSQYFIWRELSMLAPGFDFEISLYDGENSPEVQFRAITTVIAGGYDIILLNPVHAESALPAIRRAVEEGIYVGMLLNDLPSESRRLRSFYIGFDDFMGAEQAGLFVAENFPNGAGFAEIGGLQESREQLDRRDGFRAGIFGADSPIEEIASRNTPVGWSEHEALAIIRDFITRYRASIDIVFCHWEVAAAAVMKTFQTYGIDDIYVIGFGGFGDFDSALLGENAIAVSRNYAEMAAVALEYANNILHGESVPSRTIVPMEIIRFELDENIEPE